MENKEKALSAMKITATNHKKLQALKILMDCKFTDEIVGRLFDAELEKYNYGEIRFC